MLLGCSLAPAGDISADAVDSRVRDGWEQYRCLTTIQMCITVFTNIHSTCTSTVFSRLISLYTLAYF